MKIDTLVLSGGGPSGIAYTGIFKALFERKILSPDLSGIQEIITTSVGILFAFSLLLGLTIPTIQEIVRRFDIKSLIHPEDISINDLLLDFGLYPTTGIRDIFQSLIKRVLNKDNLTLHELYEIKGIKLTVKVFNTTRQQIEYISHESHPTLSIITLAQMTTAIPIFFKPVNYEGNLYTDGGLRGSLPIEICQSENYLGVYVNGLSSDKLFTSGIGEVVPILRFMYSLLVEQDQIVYDVKNGVKNKRIIYIPIKLGLNFDLDDSLKQEVIDKGYEGATTHINEHFTESAKETPEHSCGNT